MNRFKGFSLAALGLLSMTLAGCQPKSTAQKAEDTMEDAAHEAGQAAERAGEKVEDATD